jgi:hypothetical protein
MCRSWQRRLQLIPIVGYTPPQGEAQPHGRREVIGGDYLRAMQIRSSRAALSTTPIPRRRRRS